MEQPTDVRSALGKTNSEPDLHLNTASFYLFKRSEE